MKSKLNILVADDHVLFTKTFSLYLSAYAWCNCVYTAFNGKEVIDVVSANKIDLIFLDHRMPVMDGYETTLLLKKQFPAIKIIVLSQFDSAELINHYLKAGVHAYLLKNDDGIESAITAVMNGKVYISNSISAHVHVEASNRPIKFTDKEILILKCLTGGESNTLIAQNLGVSKNSIETYRKRMLKKFQANSITELINYAHKIGAL